MPRLPIVGGDDGDWGEILNEFLEASLDNENVDEGQRGKLKPAAVDAAGAVMNTDTATTDMQFVVDEDNMASDSATKIPTQQSVKAYVDANSNKATWGVITGTLSNQTDLQNALNAKEAKAKVTPIAVSTTTAAGTAAKVATTVGGTYTPTLGDIIVVTFKAANTATSPTINIDGSGAKNILLGNVNPTAVAMAGTKVMMWYDGTAFQLFGSQRVSDTDTNTTYVAATTFTAVSGTTQAAAVNNGYIANNTLEVNVTLPATVAIGQIVHVLGLGSGGWRVTAPAGDNIMLDGNSTGAAGYISGGQYASVSLRCIVANTTWEVVDYTGVITTGAGYSTAKQPLDADLTALAAAGNSTVLAATTASFLTEDETKLDGIEAGADVTDATNVDAAGAVMNTDTATTDMQFVVDEDDMVSNSATKLPTQQSVKAYVDTTASGKANASHTHVVGDVDATGTADSTTYLRGDGTWDTPPHIVSQDSAPTDTDMIWHDTDEDISSMYLPQGGSTGQVLAKTSSSSYATQWVDKSPDYKWVSPAEFGVMASFTQGLNTLGNTQQVYINITPGNHRRAAIPAPPISWNTMDIEVYWATPTTDSGTILLYIDYAQLTVGSGATNTASSNTLNATGVANTLNVSTIATGIPAYSELGTYNIRYGASSTYPGSVHIIGLKYIRKT